MYDLMLCLPSVTNTDLGTTQLACARSRLHLRHTIYGSEGGLSEDSGTITPQQFQQWQHSIRIHPHQQNVSYIRSKPRFQFIHRTSFLQRMYWM